MIDPDVTARHHSFHAKFALLPVNVHVAVIAPFDCDGFDPESTFW